MKKSKKTNKLKYDKKTYHTRIISLNSINFKHKKTTRRLGGFQNYPLNGQSNKKIKKKKKSDKKMKKNLSHWNNNIDHYRFQ